MGKDTCMQKTIKHASGTMRHACNTGEKQQTIASGGVTHAINIISILHACVIDTDCLSEKKYAFEMIFKNVYKY